jgi:hypothetical protein
MAYTRYLYPKLNFALTHCSGIIDDNQMLIYIMSFQAETKNFELIRELVDLRSLRNLDKLTAKGLIRIAHMHRDLFSGRDFRRAVLNRPDAFTQVSEIYSMLLSRENMKMKVFEGDLDEPLAWLGYEKDDSRRLKRFIDKRAKAASPRCPVNL